MGKPRKPYIRIIGSPSETGIIQEVNGDILIVKMLTGKMTGRIVQTKRSHVLQYKYL